jgi:shikimate dehydrogenase
MDRYAVVGHPIDHSLSPRIHRLFAEQTGQDLDYSAIDLQPGDFEAGIRRLQADGFKGLNVTVPFKEKAFALADRCSPRARDARAVNTLIFATETEKDEEGNERLHPRIFADNTDGAGLVRDLANHRVLVPNRRILVLGAGGAVRGILGPLLVQQPELLTVANRSLERAEQLRDDFAHIGPLQARSFQALHSDIHEDKYHLIINGTSAGLSGEVPPLPDDILGIHSVCYDLMYSLNEPTAFQRWAEERGALMALDGLGMLVEQAAEAFYLWRGLRPQTDSVIEQLRLGSP